MTKLTGETFNIEEENIKKIKELFPEVDTDGKIDFDKLKQLLGDYAEDSDERYNFTWNGKGEALRISQTPSMGTLRPAPEESKNWDETENLYIEGDNLEVLKLLQKSYFNKVDVIYIDPPYNTGGDFVYKDDFKDNIKNYKEITGQVDSEGQHTTTNREYSGRYHTDWLNMIYPRLRVARNILTEDGIVFISIDGAELMNLQKIMDNIFGENNLLGLISVVNNLKGRSDDIFFATSNEFLLVYAKNKSKALITGFDMDDEMLSEYKYKDSISRYKLTGLKKTGKNSYKEDRPNMYYPIYYNEDTQVFSLNKSKDSIEIYPEINNRDGRWRWGKETFLERKDTELICKKQQNGHVVYVKMRDTVEGEVRTIRPKTTWIDPKYDSGAGTREMREMFQENIFENPKPIEYIKDILKISTNSDSVILDFFAGSSTTAHAVMDLNAEDNGNRKFIMVQLPEEIDKKSEAFKAGYKNIAEIGKERIRRAGDQIKDELIGKYESASEEERKEMKHPDDLDIGFKPFKLDSSNIKEWNPGQYDDVQLAIEDSLTPYVEGRTEIDVVFEMILKMGLDLTYPVEEYEVNGKTIYSIGYGFLMISLANDIDLAIAEKMIEIKDEYQPEEFRVIFRDEGFRNDTDKTNIKETLRSAGLAEEAFITL